MTKQMSPGRQGAPLIVPHDVAAAVGLLTRLPVRIDGDRAMARGARAAWAYPLVGAGLGAVQGAVFALAVAMSVPVGVAAVLALATGIIATGALHEDGLADTADGFWGGWDRARRLEIMKDSRIGTYGVLALILTVLLRWQAIAAMADPSLVWAAMIGAGALSRGAMVALWHALPPARPEGLSARVGSPGRATTLLALLCAIATGVVTLPVPSAGIVIAVAAAVTLGLGRAARVRIGGQTGDVLGAAQQLSETAALVAIAAALSV